MQKGSKKHLLKTPISPDLRSRVELLIKDLEGFRTSLSALHYTKNEKEFFSQMEEFWDFIYSYIDKEAFHVFYQTKEFDDYKAFFTNINAYFERGLETVESFNVISKSFDNDILDLLGKSFSKKVFYQTNEEIKEIGNDCETLVMVGCGSMPETIIGIAENTSIKNIIGLDINSEAISVAGRVIHKLGLDNRVSLFLANGKDFNYEDADYVHVANFVVGKNEVLNQISSTARGGCKIFTRNTRLLSHLVYESVYPEMYNRLIEKGSLKGTYHTVNILEKFEISS